jgi:hypothetical protein
VKKENIFKRSRRKTLKERKDFFKKDQEKKL